MVKNKIKTDIPLIKNNDSFTLNLSKDLYNKNVILKALDEDKEWVQEVEASEKYYHIELKTSDIEDVYNWMNYLIYLQKG